LAALSSIRIDLPFIGQRCTEEVALAKALIALHPRQGVLKIYCSIGSEKGSLFMQPGWGTPRRSEPRPPFARQSWGPRRTLALGAGLGLLFVASLASAQSDASSGTNTEALSNTDPLGEEYNDRLRHLGLMFDLGSVDGGMLSLVYRPSPWLRMYGGGGTNGAAAGVRLGAALSPFHWRGVALNLDGGHFFPGDVNGIFSAFAGSRYDDSRVLEHFDYDFVNLQAGWEIERGGLMFFARGGVALVWSQVPAEGLSRLRNRSPLVDPDGSIEAFLPSVRIGLIGFL
jgi:hypothetical protein